jgi:hypothetical protein
LALQPSFTILGEIKSFAPAGIQIPDCPRCSQSLYERYITHKKYYSEKLNRIEFAKPKRRYKNGITQ